MRGTTFVSAISLFLIMVPLTWAGEDDLIWSTYLGGSSHDYGCAMAIDSARNIYLTGRTVSTNFPTTSGAFDTVYNAEDDIFVAKLNSLGNILQYATFLGGDSSDCGEAIAVDISGNAYVTGGTRSIDFPITTGAFDSTHNGLVDVYVTKIDASAGLLIYSTFLGGSNSEGGSGIVVDNCGNAYLTGSTESENFPTTLGSFDISYNGNSGDAFVVKLNLTGDSLIYSTFLGGASGDSSYDISIDDSGNTYLTGETNSSDFPTTSGAYDESYNGGVTMYGDVFVTKLNPSGSALIYSTFMGGNDDDIARGIAVDELGHAFVTGRTESEDFPTTAGAFDTTLYNLSYSDAFVAKLTPAGDSLNYSTYLGGYYSDEAWDIAIDDSGRAYVTGGTKSDKSDNFPTTAWAFDPEGSYNDVFITKFDKKGSVLEYSTFLAADYNSTDQGMAIILDDSCDVYVTGYTQSYGFPTTPGAYDETHNGNFDAFVVKMEMSYVIGYGSIDGTVAAGTKGPIAGAVVTAEGYDTASDTTDGNGYFLIEDLSNGPYEISVFVSGYYPHAEDDVEVLTGDTTTVNFFLNPFSEDLAWSTFLGKGHGYSVAVDPLGNAYITGETSSPDFPTTAGAFDEINNGWDAFVAKYDPTGSTLVYATFLGGTSSDEGYGIAVDGTGHAYVTGYTYSTGFPTTVGAYDRTHNGSYDVFVTKLNPAGSALLYSTFLGGENSEEGYAITVTGSDNAFVTGYTSSSNFPTTAEAYDETFNGYYDVFVTKLNPAGSALEYSTFLGGTNRDTGGEAIAVDDSGNAFVTGNTDSPDFPTTTGAFDETYNGDTYDVFVTKFNTAGSDIVYSTFLGGGGIDGGAGIAVDGAGNAYVTGGAGYGFPTTSGAFDETYNGADDVFVTKFNTAGSDLIYSTLLGGIGSDAGDGIAIDDSGSAYVTGFTESIDFPTTIGAFDETHNGGGIYDYKDIFVTKLNPTGSALDYSTFLGGNEDDYGEDIALDLFGNPYMTGSTYSNNFPTTPGVFDSTYNSSSGNIFVTKLGIGGELAFGAIGGIVSEAEGPIEDAIVTIENRFTWSDTTDASGFYIIENLPAIGLYDVTASASGYWPYTEEDVEVLENMTTTVNFVLQTKTYGSIGGIISEAKAPIEGAVVTAEGDTTVSDTTDASGYYIIQNILTGLYDVTASGRGYSAHVEEDIQVLEGDTTTVNFSLEVWDLDWSTFLGGSGEDKGGGIAVGHLGNAYMTGYTNSSDFPVTAGAYDTVFNGGTYDVVVVKLSSTGNSLEYATYLGGSKEEQGQRIALDGSGNAYVTGYTGSSDFPTTSGAFDTSYNGPTFFGADVYVAKLNATGNTLVYSTFLGGTSKDYGYGITVDDSGYAYCIGYTTSANFPTTAGTFDETHNGGNDVFVAKLNPLGSGLSYSTFLGGSAAELGLGINVDDSGNAYTTGMTKSSSFPTTSGAYDETHNGNDDVFVTKFSATGNGLVFSTFLGADAYEGAYGIGIDDSGNVYLGGETESSNFPTTSGAFDETYNGSCDVFVVKLNATGSALVYSTFVGGSGEEYCNNFALSDSDYAFPSGHTNSLDFPTTSGAFDETHNGNDDAYMVQVNRMGSGLQYASYLGGSDLDRAWGIAVDRFNNVYLTGETESSDFPVTTGAFDETYNDGIDAFVSKFGIGVVGDLIPPAAIDDLVCTLENGSSKSTSGDIKLWWSEPYDDVGVIRYVVYRGIDAYSWGDSLAGTADTTFNDAGVVGTVGTNYFYAVKAVDAAGNKSEESNKVGEYDINMNNGE